MRCGAGERGNGGEGMDWTGCFLLPLGAGGFLGWPAAAAALLRSGTALRSALLLRAYWPPCAAAAGCCFRCHCSPSRGAPASASGKECTTGPARCRPPRFTTHVTPKGLFSCGEENFCVRCWKEVVRDFRILIKNKL
jgi:hypothetical protein